MGKPSFSEVQLNCPSSQSQENTKSGLELMSLGFRMPHITKCLQESFPDLCSGQFTYSLGTFLLSPYDVPGTEQKQQLRPKVSEEIHVLDSIFLPL